MKRLNLIGGLLAAIVCSQLGAQTIETRANIPFDFRVGNNLMPAGEYSIHNASGVLVVRQAGGSGPSALVITNRDFRSGTSDKDYLEFSRYGTTYFLKGLWTASGEGRSLVKSSHEKELARNGGVVQTAGIALGTK